MDYQMRDTAPMKTGLDWEALLPQQRQSAVLTRRGRRSNWTGTRWLIRCILVSAWVWYSHHIWSAEQSTMGSFYANITSPQNICPAVDGPAISHSGYIGLKGDSNDTPKRSFFWYFEAQHDAETAPIIMTIGGGPGTSGMMNPMWAQGPCLSAENGTSVPNPNRWTEHFNLLALDHPIGVGFSYGTMVNNSRDAAMDSYDFLQRFFRLYPHLSRNKVVLSGGSYGGTYVPHIATVIHQQNLAVAAGRGQSGAIHINLESMMISNPMSDATSHFSWVLNRLCHGPVPMYNASTCAAKFQDLPKCLDSIRFAEQVPGWDVERRSAADKICGSLRDGDTHGIVREDIRKTCFSEDPLGCLPPAFRWTKAFFDRPDVKDALGVPEHINFTSLSNPVSVEFAKYGDIIQSAYLLYGPLLKAGIRLLHYVGAQDANCSPAGIMSFLKLLQSPFQDKFLRTPDVPWPTAEDATVRVVGKGAGNMTWILINGGGHFVAHDQPELVKSIIEQWVENVPFF
ncbi:SET domain-containing protein [Mycena venus]|uniref:SET domain-containing protein n=1 Tax=Mycena venus TaxID=2733690 RepID=A0A8H6XQE1_9AGAR|nr:SET domain-containing protein [Mycena venus]